jgi:hypothetical protein
MLRSSVSVFVRTCSYLFGRDFQRVTSRSNDKFDGMRPDINFRMNEILL